MKIIGTMLSRMIFFRFVAVLLGISLFVLTLEVVSFSKEILALDESSSSMVFRYILMRLPGTLATFLPMSFLLALLLSLTELSYRNEVTAIWASGVSPARLIVMLVPLSLVIGVFHYVLADRAIPVTAPTLRIWGIADYGDKRLKLGERDPIWMRSGNDILRAGKANADSTELRDVIIFRRDEQGELVSQIMAPFAKLGTASWELKDAVVVTQASAATTAMPILTYEGTLRPAAAGSRSGDPEEMTITDLSYFVANAGFGIRPTYVYETWWHKRLTPLFTGLLMTAICVPLASRFRRGGGLGVLFSAGVGLGFLYFIFDGLMVSAGELGFVVPWLAAWLPVLVFGTIAASLVLRSERT